MTDTAKKLPRGTQLTFLPRRIYICSAFLLLFMMNGVLTAVFSADERLAEAYASAVLPAVRGVIAGFFGIFHFSCAEVIVIALVAAAIIYIIRTVIGCVRRGKRGFEPYLASRVTSVLAVVSCAVFLFTSLYGACYYRRRVTDDIIPYHFTYNTAGVAKVALDMINEMNYLRSEMALRDDEHFALSLSFDELADECRTAYRSAAQYYSFYDGGGGVKPVLLSKPWTYTFIIGMYFPYTAEANINTNIPDIELANTMLHEMAHQRGIAREEEADFSAFLISRFSASEEIRYSALYSALSGVLSAVAYSDAKTCSELIAHMSDGVREDISYVSDFWEKYETKVADVSTDINNTYLESNGQTLGVASYSYATQLILDFYSAVDAGMIKNIA